MLIKGNENGDVVEENWELIHDEPPETEEVNVETNDLALSTMHAIDGQVSHRNMTDSSMTMENDSADSNNGTKDKFIEDTSLVVTDSTTPLLLETEKDQIVDKPVNTASANVLQLDGVDGSPANLPKNKIANNVTASPLLTEEFDDTPENGTSSTVLNYSTQDSTHSKPLLDSDAISKSFQVARRKIRNTVNDIDDERHKIQESTISSLKNIGTSTKALGESLLEETGTVDTAKRACTEHSVEEKAQMAAENVKRMATNLKRAAIDLNDTYRITDKLASVAVVVGTIEFARGDRNGGIGAMAAAGASLCAGEAMRAPTQSTELNETLHMD